MSHPTTGAPALHDLHGDAHVRSSSLPSDELALVLDADAFPLDPPVTDEELELLSKAHDHQHAPALPSAKPGDYLPAVVVGRESVGVESFLHVLSDDGRGIALRTIGGAFAYCPAGNRGKLVYSESIDACRGWWFERDLTPAEQAAEDEYQRGCNALLIPRTLTLFGRTWTVRQVAKLRAPFEVDGDILTIWLPLNPSLETLLDASAAAGQWEPPLKPRPILSRPIRLNPEAWGVGPKPAA